MVDAMINYFIDALAEYNSECMRQAVSNSGIPSVFLCILGQPGLLNKILFGYPTLLTAIFYDIGRAIQWATNGAGYTLNELKEYNSVDTTDVYAAQQSPMSPPDISYLWTVVLGLLSHIDRYPYSSFFIFLMGLIIFRSGGQRVRQAWYRRYPQSARETSFESFKSMIEAGDSEGAEARFKWMRARFTTVIQDAYMKTIYTRIPKTPDDLRAAMVSETAHIQTLLKEMEDANVSSAWKTQALETLSQPLSCPVCFEEDCTDVVAFECLHAVCHDCFERICHTAGVSHRDAVKCAACARMSPGYRLHIPAADESNERSDWGVRLACGASNASDFTVTRTYAHTATAPAVAASAALRESAPAGRRGPTRARCRTAPTGSPRV